MAQKPINLSTFPGELRAAGLQALPFSAQPDGSILYDKAITDAQRAAIEAVYVSHDPTKGRERTAPAYLLISALSDDQVAALATAKAKDQRLLSARIDPWPETNPKIARIATRIGIKPAAWFDAVAAMQKAT